MALFAPFSSLLFFVFVFQYGDSAPCLPGTLARYFWSNQHVLVGPTENPIGRIHCTWNWFLGSATTCPYYPRADSGGTDISNMLFETTPTGTWACAGPNGQNSCWYTAEVVSGPDAQTGKYKTDDGTETDYRQIFSGVMGTDGQCNDISSDCASADTWACQPGYMPKDLLYPYSDYQTCKEAFCDINTYKMACCAKECSTGYFSQVGNQCPAGTYGGAYGHACRESTCTAADEDRCCIETTFCLPDDDVEAFGTPDAQNGNYQDVIIGNALQGRVLCEWTNRHEPPMECPYYKVGESTVDSMVNCAIEGGLGPRYCWSTAIIVDGPHQSGIYKTRDSVERDWFRLFKQTHTGYTACHRPDNDCAWQEYQCHEAKSPVAWLLPDQQGGPGWFSCQARYCKQESFAAACCATTTNTSTTTNQTTTRTSTTTNHTTSSTSNTTSLTRVTFTSTNTTSTTSTNTSSTTNQTTTRTLTTTNHTTSSTINTTSQQWRVEHTNLTTISNSTTTGRTSTTTRNTTISIITTTSVSNASETINVTSMSTTYSSSLVSNTTHTTNTTRISSLFSKPMNTTTTVNLSGTTASWSRTTNITFSSNYTIEAVSSSLHGSESNTTSSTNGTGVTVAMDQKANTTSRFNTTITSQPMGLEANATSSANKTVTSLSPSPSTSSTNTTLAKTTSTTNITTGTNTTTMTKSPSTSASFNLSTSTNTTTIATSRTTTNATTTIMTTTITTNISTTNITVRPQTITTATITTTTTGTNISNATVGTSYVDSYAWSLNFTLSNESETGGTGGTENGMALAPALAPHIPSSGQTGQQAGQTVVSAQVLVVSGRVSLHIEWDGPNAVAFAADARVRTAITSAVATMAGVAIEQVEILSVTVNR